MKRRWVWEALLLLVVAAAPPLLSQSSAPVISGLRTLISEIPPGGNFPVNVPIGPGNAITAGTPTSFTLEVDLQSSISTCSLQSVVWQNVTNPSLSETFTFPGCALLLRGGSAPLSARLGGRPHLEQSVSFSQSCPSGVPQCLVAVIPTSLYPSSAAGPSGTVTNTVNIIVETSVGNSAPATFTINPPLKANNPLPNGSVHIAYSANLFSGGTGGFSNNFIGGQIPPGIFISGVNTDSAAGPAIFGTPQQAGTYTFQIQTTDVWNNALNVNYSLTITPVQITSGPPPAGAVGLPYSFQPTASGGLAPYTWSATGLPAGLNINPATGLISGTPTQGSPTGPLTANIVLSVMDSGQASATANYSVSVYTPPPNLPTVQILTPSLTVGMVGTPYSAVIEAAGGVSPYTFSVSLGSLPPGLSLSSGGQLSGTPTTAGSYNFTVRANDSGIGSAFQPYTLVILPQLVITTASPLSDLPLATPSSVTFAATGGAPPYVFSASGSLPPGTSVTPAGKLSGTPTATGSYQFQVTVTDSDRFTATKQFTVNVVVAPLVITTASPLPNGQVAVGYSAQFGATGGVPPYTWQASGVPTGLAFSSNSSGGALSGTPAAEGQFTVTVSVSDTQSHTASKDFSLTILPGKLTITTSSLPNGTVGTPYGAPPLAAIGGTKPYTWSAGGLPGGVAVDSGGNFSGSPTAAGQFSVAITVSDSKGGQASETLPLTVVVAPLRVVPTVAPGVAGTPYSGNLAATGGVGPYTWSAGGLPANLSAAASGAISGIPQAPGTASFTATVTDSKGATASGPVQIVIGLPLAPPLNFSGLPSTSNPATQPNFQLGLGQSFPADVTVTLTLTFAPDSGPDDPSVQFATGGRTATVTIPAGSAANVSGLGIQTGTVAGLITITAQMQAGGQDVTPKPAPSATIRVNATPPVLTSVTATRTGSGFTVTVVGFAPTRDLTQATFQFTGAPGSNLQTSSLSIAVDTLFTQWYSNPASAQFGSQFKFTQTFTVTGDTQSISSVSVTLASKAGTSAAVSATLQ